MIFSFAKAELSKAKPKVTNKQTNNPTCTTITFNSSLLGCVHCANINLFCALNSFRNGHKMAESYTISAPLKNMQTIKHRKPGIFFLCSFIYFFLSLLLMCAGIHFVYTFLVVCFLENW